QRLSPGGPHTLEPVPRDDLLDLAIFCSDLRVRLASTAGKKEALGQALEILNQAEATFGPNPALEEERKFHGAPARASRAVPRTAWDHFALGRSLLRAGALKRAADEIDQALRLQPQGLWPNFYHGLCAFRLGRHEDAVMAFSVCIGVAPEAA